MNNWQPRSFGGPRRASNRTPDRSSGRLEAERSCRRPRASSGNRITRMASTIQGRLTRGHESSSTDEILADVATPRQHFFFPRILHQCLPQTQQEESTIYSLIFPQTCTAKIADARKLRGYRAREILTIGRTEQELPKDFWIWYQQTTRFSMKNTNLDCITNMQWLCRTRRRNGFKVNHAKTNQLRKCKEV